MCGRMLPHDAMDPGNLGLGDIGLLIMDSSGYNTHARVLCSWIHKQNTWTNLEGLHDNTPAPVYGMVMHNIRVVLCRCIAVSMVWQPTASTSTQQVGQLTGWSFPRPSLCRQAPVLLELASCRFVLLAVQLPSGVGMHCAFVGATKASFVVHDCYCRCTRANYQTNAW